MSSIKTSLLIALLACASACGRQVVEFKLGDEIDAGLDGRVDARVDAPGDTSNVDGGVDGSVDGNNIDGAIDGTMANPLLIVSTVPAPNATGVALNTVITATFNRPVNAGTISNLTFLVRQGSTTVNGIVALDLAGTTARFTPTPALLSNLVYTATITTGAQDPMGQSLAANHVWMFTTLNTAMPPTVISETPGINAVNVSMNKSPTATFSKPMNPATINMTTFTLRQGLTTLTGMVSYDPLTNTATFDPMNSLTPGLVYTATITTGAMDTMAMALQANFTWMFTVGACGQAPITLGSSGNFAVLAGSTVTNTGPSMVIGDLGVSPGSGVTGFPPGILAGQQHTDSTSATAVDDLTTAYNEAAGRTLCPVTVAGNLGGMTLAPGLYKSTSFLEITSGDLTLDAQGDSDAVWVFQMATTMTTTIDRRVVLAGGAKASNIYWQVGSSATIGTGSTFQGTIMADQAITLNTGATLNGRALARIAAVSLDSNAVTRPAP